MYRNLVNLFSKFGSKKPFATTKKFKNLVRIQNFTEKKGWCMGNN
jgi:hypothetical protein